MKKLQRNKDYPTESINPTLLRGLLCRLYGNDGICRECRYNDPSFLLEFKNSNMVCITDSSMGSQASWYDYIGMKLTDKPPVGTLLDSVNLSLSSANETCWCGVAKYIVVAQHATKDIFFVEAITRHGETLGEILQLSVNSKGIRPLDVEELSKKDKTIMAVAKSLGALCPEPEVLNALYASGCLKTPDGGSRID